jgi:WD40 repeat protein
VKIWESGAASKQPKAVLTKFKGVVRRMMFLPESRLLLTAGDGGQVILWDWDKAEPRHEWRLDQKLICSMSISEDASFVAAGASDGSVTLFDLVPE